jgi:hypothetical protein
VITSLNLPESLSLSCFLVATAGLAIGFAVADFFGTALGATSFFDFFDFLSDDFLGLVSLPDDVADDALRLRVTAPDFFPVGTFVPADLEFFFPDF